MMGSFFRELFRVRWLWGLFFCQVVVGGEVWDVDDVKAKGSSGGWGVPNDVLLVNQVQGLSFDERKDVLYLLMRLQRGKLVKLLGNELLEESPRDHEVLVVMADFYLNAGEPQKLLEMGEQIRRFYPEDDRGEYFVSAAYDQMGRYRESRALLGELKGEFKKARRIFPYRVDYASALWRSGDWRRAMATYQRILGDGEVDEELRSDVRVVLDDIYREHLPQGLWEWGWTDLETSEVMRSGMFFEYALTNRHRLYVDWRRDDLMIEAGGGFREVHEGRQGGMVRVETRHSVQWVSRFGVGGYGRDGGDAGVMGSVEFEHLLEPGRLIRVGGNFRERAVDSVALEALDGRKDEVYVGLDYQVTEDMFLRWRGAGKQVWVDDDIYGDGFQFDLGMEYVLMRKPFELTLGYDGVYAGFGRGSDDSGVVRRFVQDGGDLNGVFNGLVEAETNRHEVFLRIRGQVTKQWRYEFTGLGGYLASSDSEVYGANGEVAYLLRKSMEVRLRGSYSSSGSGGNAGSESKEIGVGLKVYF